MAPRGSALVRVVCWFCAHEFRTRRSDGMVRCPSCRTFNHLPQRKGASA